MRCQFFTVYLHNDLYDYVFSMMRREFPFFLMYSFCKIQHTHNSLKKFDCQQMLDFYCSGYSDVAGGIWSVRSQSCTNIHVIDTTRVMLGGSWRVLEFGPIVTSERMFVNLSYTLDAPALTYSVFEVALVDRRTLSHIRYPPLHVHHLRVEGGSKYEVAESFNADSTNYADSPFRQDYGAYAMSVAHPRMTALIRDVGNATGAWSLVVKFFTPSVTHTNASLFISGHVASPNSFDGLHVKTDDAYVFVYSGRFPISGRLLPTLSRLHTHTGYMMQSALLILGPTPSLLSGCNVRGDRVSSFKMSVTSLTHYLKQSSTVICEGNGTRKWVNGAYYTQRPTLSCRDWIFTNNVYTSVNFLWPACNCSPPFDVVEIHSEWLLRYQDAMNETHLMYRKFASESNAAGYVGNAVNFGLLAGICTVGYYLIRQTPSLLLL